MKSAIELYKEAYELDYRKGNWEDAEDLYKKIIATYPHADEKEYSEVHLARIQRLKETGGEDERLLPSRGTARSSASGLSVVSFLLCLLLLAAGGYFFFSNMQLRQRIDNQSIIIQGLHAFNNGNLIRAETDFQKAQIAFPKDELPYMLLIDTYIMTEKINLAETELSKWKVTVPYSRSLDLYEKKIRFALEKQ
jgi:outer membrane protein assembly factor BamD (BamD/ComL family)